MVIDNDDSCIGLEPLAGRVGRVAGNGPERKGGNGSPKKRGPNP